MRPLAWFERLVRAIGRFRERERLRGEMAHIDQQGEFDAVLRDAGVSRAQWPTLLAGHPDSVELLAAMLARLGIEQRHLGPVATQREVGWNCVTCTDKRRCRAWTVDGGADPDGYRSFCPNRRELDGAWRRAAGEKGR